MTRFPSVFSVRPAQSAPRRAWALARHLGPALVFAVAWVALAGCGPSQADSGQPQDRGAALIAAKAKLDIALNTRDLPAVQSAVAEARAALGDRAGVPEKEERHQPIPRDVAPLTAAEARAAAAPALARLQARRWWRVGLDPTRLGQPLREPAEAIVGALALAQADPAIAADALRVAREAGDFLLWAQDQAGSGAFPFPASRGVSDTPPFRAAARALDAAERSGRLARTVRNGWFYDDTGDGGLQFDTGECGVAMLRLYEATGEVRYLFAARRAGDWATGRTPVANWNYNSFSVYLLAELHRVTGERHYLDAALKRARIGVIPGQLRDGANAGRWLDPHNARVPYHYIMLRALAALARELPPGADRSEVEAALRLGLRARNPEFAGPGAPNKDHALQTLLMVDALYREQPAVLRDTGTTAALDALQRLCSDALRDGRDPLAPRALGLLLAHRVAAG